jgi:hypothetical protein
MYRVLIQLADGTWDEQGHSKSFSKAWAFARTLIEQDQHRSVRITGPDGFGHIWPGQPTIGELELKYGPEKTWADRHDI